MQPFCVKTEIERVTSMHIILGTMTFSDQVDQQIASTMVARFRDAGHSQVDTAFIYNKGKTEALLGTLNADEMLNDCEIAGKANPRGGPGLTAESVTMQLNTSLQRMGKSSLDLFYYIAQTWIPQLQKLFWLSINSLRPGSSNVLD